MDVSQVRKYVDAIDAAGITRYKLYCNNSYLIEVDSDSTRVVFDDDNEMMYIFRVPNLVMPQNTKEKPEEVITINLEITTYAMIERFIISTNAPIAIDLAESLGLTLTDDLTDWIKGAANQIGLYPIQSPGQKRKDSDGNPIKDYHGIPTCISR